MTANTFTMQNWTENVASGPDDGPRVAYAHATFAYQGLIEGISSSDSLLYYPGTGHDGGGVTSPGYERFEASVDGRKGSFVIRHEYAFTATEEAHEVTSRFTVVPGSATGELAGLTGSGTVWGSSETMNYAFTPEFGA